MSQDVILGTLLPHANVSGAAISTQFGLCRVEQTWPRVRLSSATCGFALQRAVLDGPVLDQTGLEGRYDFVLTWLPTGTEFGREASTATTERQSSAGPVPGNPGAVRNEAGSG
jgi:uncharacterized protein (TIGR03435 family)